jgi:SRSO17 transposase
VLSRADGDANAVRDELHTDILHHLGDANGVLVLDETGFLKKGQHSAGPRAGEPGIVCARGVGS